uniref:Copia protein n=1 Tax=Culex pipiens TaxID=7175 RepID=A0A8D8G220_CULPI
MTIDPENLTVAKVKANLLNDYVKQKERSGAGQEETKPAVFLGKTDRRRKPFPGQCCRCKQTGHKSFECQAPEEEAGSSRESGGEVAGRLPTKKKAFQLRRPDAEEGEETVPRGGFAFMTKTTELKRKGGSEVTWIIDSGCTDHMVNDSSLFLAEQTLKSSYPVSLAEEGQAIAATKVGFISAMSYVQGKEYLCEVSDVLYAPGLRHNLLSVSRLEKAGFSVVFRNGVVELLDGNTIFAVGKRTQDLYELSFTLNRVEANSIQANVDRNILWHRRLAHLGIKSVRDLARRQMAKGIDSSITDSAELCEACIMGKHSRPPFRSRESRASRPLERVHTDVCGPITPATWDGKRDEVFPRFKEYKAMVEAGFDLPLQRPLSKLRCDNGGE